MATRADVNELLDKMAQERGKLIEAAMSLSAPDSLAVPQNAEGEEQWTAREQLAHLWEMERSYDSWVRLALERDGAPISEATPRPVDIPIENANAYEVPTLVHYLEMERMYTIGLIEGIPLEYYERTASSPMFGELTVLQWLRSFYRHDRQHAAQISGRQSDYRPNFKNGEPNQRQMRIDLVARRRAGKL